MITEIIASAKPVVSKGRELVLVLTKSGAQIWVNKAQYSDKAVSVTYTSHKAGDKWLNTATGEEGVRTVASNTFEGLGTYNQYRASLIVSN